MRRFLRWVYVGVLCVAVVVIGLRVGNGVETGIFALLGGDSQNVMARVASHSSGQVRVLLEGDKTSAQWQQVCNEFRLRFGDSGNFEDTLKFLQLHADGLLAQSTRQQLMVGDWTNVVNEAVATLCSGFVPPLFSLKQDPMMLATGFVMALQKQSLPGWAWQDGALTREIEGSQQALLTGETHNLEVAYAFLQQAEKINSVENSSVHVWCSGSPFHTAMMVRCSKREVNVLSVISLVVVLALGWWLFRTVRFVGWVLGALVAGAVLASGGLWLGWERPHIVTFVFGTSLVGLAVDYTYHVLAIGDVRRILRTLTYAMVTTLACFVPLLFSTVGVLRQMACFTMCGLVGVYGVVVLFFPQGKAWAQIPIRQWRFPKLWVGILCVVAVLGVVRIKSGGDISAFYQPRGYLAESERRVSAVQGVADVGFVVVEGENLQQALEREEAFGVAGISQFLPSLKRQQENSLLISNLYVRAGEAYKEFTGLKVPAVVGNKFVDADNVNDPLLLKLKRAMVCNTPTGVMLIAPHYEKGATESNRMQSKASENIESNRMQANAGENIECNRKQSNAIENIESNRKQSNASDNGAKVLVSPRLVLSQMFQRYAHETYRLLWVALAVLCAGLIVILRKRALRCVLPVLGAALSTLGVLGWCGVTINFFHAICFFVFIGLGIDYVLFYQLDSDCLTKRVVLFSFLTSFVGLGLLAWTSFAVTSAMGGTLALGLLFAYLWARLVSDEGYEKSKSKPIKPTISETWYTQREQSAGRLRMLFLWYVYRFLGKRILKALVALIFCFIYPFAHSARVALEQFYKVLWTYQKKVKNEKGKYPIFRHLLGYAWELVEKLDVCTYQKGQPKMQIVEDAHSEAFFRYQAKHQGVFLMASHLGTIEVLSALRELGMREGKLGMRNEELRIGEGELGIKNEVSSQYFPHVHAFQEMGHDQEFMRIITAHFKQAAFTLHAVEDIGVETASQMQEALAHGDMVLMAADRVSAHSSKTLSHDFLGYNVSWPKGVFVFARLMASPIFFVTCIRTTGGVYQVRFKEFRSGENVKVESILHQYVTFLEEQTIKHPHAWYHFYPFFGNS